MTEALDKRRENVQLVRGHDGRIDFVKSTQKQQMEKDVKQRRSERAIEGGMLLKEVQIAVEDGTWVKMSFCCLSFWGHHNTCSPCHWPQQFRRPGVRSERWQEKRQRGVIRIAILVNGI
jgi:hypothetical protein